MWSTGDGPALVPLESAPTHVGAAPTATPAKSELLPSSAPPTAVDRSRLYLVLALCALAALLFGAAAAVMAWALFGSP